MSNKLTKFEPHRLDSIIAEINEALRPIQEKYGLIDLNLGRVVWSPSEFKTNIHAKIGAAAEDSAAVLARQVRLSKAIGFGGNIFGREMFASSGEKYRVVDINTRKPKYPIIAEMISNPSKRLAFTVGVQFIGEQPPSLYNNRPGTRIIRLGGGN